MTDHSGHRSRKRRQFRDHGIDAFADHEVLELLLYYAIPRRDTNPVAHALIDRFGSLNAVLSAPVEELERVPGMGANAALLLKLVPQVYRRARISITENEVILDTTERIGEFFVEQFVAQTSEVMYQLCLDAKGKLLACRLLGDGTVDAVSFSARRVLENAIQTRASLVALGHNHPSGVAIPSQEDIAATRSVADALRAVDIPLVDPVVVADNDFVSRADSGLTW